MSLGQCSPETLLGATDPGKSSIRSVDPETGHSKFKFEEVIVSNGSVYNGLFVLKKNCRYLIFKKYNNATNHQKLTNFLRCRSRTTS